MKYIFFGCVIGTMFVDGLIAVLGLVNGVYPRELACRTPLDDALCLVEAIFMVGVGIYLLQ